MFGPTGRARSNHWWKIVCIAINKLLQKSGVDASHIQRIELVYQMHGLVVLDQSGNCLRNLSFGVIVERFRLEKSISRSWCKNAWITCSIALQTLLHPN